MTISHCFLRTVEMKFEELTVDEQSTLVPREEEAVASWEELRAVS